MTRLTIRSTDRKERLVDLTDEVVTLGRAPDCTVPIEDPRVSPLHCRLQRTSNGGYTLTDLDTEAGTLINGARIRTRPLESGDRILIGETEILYDTPRMRRLRSRRPPPGRRRRIVLPAKVEKVFSFDDLKILVESLIEEQGIGALDGVRKLVDEFYLEHTGEPFTEALLEERDNLYKVLEINKRINGEHDLKKLLELIIDAAIEMTGAERGFIILKENDALAIKTARNFDREAVRRPAFKISHTIAEEVIRTGKPILSADALNDPNLPAAGSVADLELRSLLCMPLTIRECTLGCVYMDNRFEAGIFIQSDLPLLRGFADQAAIAVENARLYEANVQKQQELERLGAQLRDRVEQQYAELVKVKQDFIGSRASELKYDYRSFIGSSPPMREVLTLLDKVIESDEPVLLSGESGTGKELVARAIHFNSKRAASGRFVCENCSAIPETLFESELFGHEKGAFTGAEATKIGLFEQADKGTLFLDEIGDLSIEMQKKLLRAIQEKEFRRVGGTDVLKTDVRIVSASNKNLRERIREGAFREDLFYRLNVFTIALPPLRDRREDIPLLVEHFIGKIAAETGRPKKSIDEAAVRRLCDYSWPGNVRELQNEIRRAVALSEDLIAPEILKEEIRSNDLFKPAVSISPGSGLKEIVAEAIAEVERKIILKVLDERDWKKSEAARVLGISRPTLDAKIEAYGLDSHRAAEV